MPRNHSWANLSTLIFWIFKNVLYDKITDGSMQTLNVYVRVCMCACACVCVVKMVFGLHYYVGAVASYTFFYLYFKKWVKCRNLTVKYSIRD